MIISKSQIIPSQAAVTLNGKSTTVPAYSFATIVVGSGAAGLNAADLLGAAGNPVAVVTEGLKMGTSRNTGSDKQTYYKLTLSDSTPDSVGDMAESLFEGGSVDGDLALCEAAGSTRAFMRLVDLGVPFPCNEFGEFAGYQTDHDTRTRATSCGPLTSKYMTEALERSVLSRDLPIFDGYRVVRLLTENNRAVGIAALCPDEPGGIAIFFAESIVWATGGPSAIYAATVYPESQTCAHGVLLETGARAVNVTESQYGVASTKFRWNLSGTYQQVLPRYFSTEPDGSDEHEFLADTFADPKKLLTAVFRKGYQWPFDPAKLDKAGGNFSSFVDIAIFKERVKGRRVFMDFRRNPSIAGESFDFSLLEDEPLNYLKNSRALLPTPIERLEKMNPQAIDLYKSHGIDLYNEPLEIDICAQHNNGGFEVDTSYESVSLKNLFIVGEAAGVFGVHRPGGSALNSTQVGSRRAADAIISRARHAGQISDRAPASLAGVTLTLPEPGDLGVDEILNLRRTYAERMSRVGAFIRNESDIISAIGEIRKELSGFGKYHPDSPRALTELIINRDILLTQFVYLSAILAYIGDGGKSRGSYLIASELPDGEAVDIDRGHFTKICEVWLENGEFESGWRSVRPIPKRDNWFENVLADFRTRIG